MMACASNCECSCVCALPRTTKQCEIALGVRGKGKASSYYSATFDGVHDSSSSQAAVYAPLSMVVRSAISGFNSTIVAYGQTGSGKTYTMLGPQATEASHTSTPFALTDSSGVVPRAIHDVFNALAEWESSPLHATASALQRRYTVRCSCLHVHNERVYDMLGEEGKALPVRDFGVPERPVTAAAATGKTSGKSFTTSESSAPAKLGTNVAGLSEHVVATSGEALKLLAKANKRRAVRITDWNEASSRTHTILQLMVTTEEDVPSHRLPPPGDAAGGGGGTVRRGSCDAATATGEGGKGAAVGGPMLTRKTHAKVTLVDLAGSERWPSGPGGGTISDDHVKELIHINKSLSALGNCIDALTRPSVSGREVRVPFRDSMLTRLLQDSLGGNCRTAVIATVSPSDLAIDETMSTIHFGERARHVLGSVRVNEELSEKVLLERARKEITKLKKQLELYKRLDALIQEKLRIQTGDNPGAFSHATTVQTPAPSHTGGSGSASRPPVSTSNPSTSHGTRPVHRGGVEESRDSIDALSEAIALLKAPGMFASQARGERGQGRGEVHSPSRGHGHTSARTPNDYRQGGGSEAPRGTTSGSSRSSSPKPSASTPLERKTSLGSRTHHSSDRRSRSQGGGGGGALGSTSNSRKPQGSVAAAMPEAFARTSTRASGGGNRGARLPHLPVFSSTSRLSTSARAVESSLSEPASPLSTLGRGSNVATPRVGAGTVPPVNFAQAMAVAREATNLKTSMTSLASDPPLVPSPEGMRKSFLRKFEAQRSARERGECNNSSSRRVGEVHMEGDASPFEHTPTGREGDSRRGFNPAATGLERESSEAGRLITDSITRTAVGHDHSGSAFFSTNTSRPATVGAYGRGSEAVSPSDTATMSSRSEGGGVSTATHSYSSGTTSSWSNGVATGTSLPSVKVLSSRPSIVFKTDMPSAYPQNAPSTFAHVGSLLSAGNSTVSSVRLPYVPDSSGSSRGNVTAGAVTHILSASPSSNPVSTSRTSSDAVTSGRIAGYLQKKGWQPPPPVIEEPSPLEGFLYFGEPLQPQTTRTTMPAPTPAFKLQVPVPASASLSLPTTQALTGLSSHSSTAVESHKPAPLLSDNFDSFTDNYRARLTVITAKVNSDFQKNLLNSIDRINTDTGAASAAALSAASESRAAVARLGYAGTVPVPPPANGISDRIGRPTGETTTAFGTESTERLFSKYLQPQVLPGMQTVPRTSTSQTAAPVPEQSASRLAPGLAGNPLNSTAQPPRGDNRSSAGVHTLRGGLHNPFDSIAGSGGEGSESAPKLGSALYPATASSALLPRVDPHLAAVPTSALGAPSTGTGSVDSRTLARGGAAARKPQASSKIQWLED